MMSWLQTRGGYPVGLIINLVIIDWNQVSFIIYVKISKDTFF